MAKLPTALERSDEAAGRKVGRPKNQPLVAPKIRELLLRQATRNSNMTQLEAIIQKNIELAIKGDSEARDFLFNRIDGRIPDRAEITSTNTESNPLLDLFVEIAKRNNRLSPAFSPDAVEDAEIVEEPEE